MTGGAIETFSYALVALLVILDPPGTAALFAAMTPQDTRAERAQQAKRACLIAFVVLAAFGLLGEGLLRALGIGLPAMKVAGGILLFLTAADMVTARNATRATPAEQEAATKTNEDISVFPLAIPLLAGPGAMTTMVLLRSTAAPGLASIVAVEAALAVALAITLAALLLAGQVKRLLGETGSHVIGRVLGVLLAALAAQITMDGVREALSPHVRVDAARNTNVPRRETHIRYSERVIQSDVPTDTTRVALFLPRLQAPRDIGSVVINTQDDRLATPLVIGDPIGTFLDPTPS